MKLTANQIAALKEVDSGEVRQIRLGSSYSFYIDSKVYPTVIGRLQSKGMVEWRLESDGNYTAYLTDSGKQALSACS